MPDSICGLIGICVVHIQESSLFKHCPKCNIKKNVSEFYKNKARTDGFQSWCKTCLDKKSKTYDKGETQKKYAVSHKEELRKSVDKYNATEKGKQTKKEHWLSIAYKKVRDAYSNSEKGRQSRQIRHERRRSKEAGVERTLTIKEWRGIVVSYNSSCAYCNKKSNKLTQDHIIPISKGGGHTKENVVPACSSCNSSKSNKSLIYWMAKKVSV
jgi:5-methylcytosine-specific restriction endonuclease McrA